MEASTATTPMGDEIGAALESHRRTLWRLAYQLTGDPAQAEDVVQETFLRAIERWPDTGAQLRAWLIRVATNVGIDVLRRRRRAPYIGPWLPVPIETGALEEVAAIADSKVEPEARYALRESVSYAFLTALEALTPRQRSALLLRDVLGYSAAEAADVLSTSEANVRIAHHRARRALSAYDARNRISTAELGEATLQALSRFVACLRSDDVAGLEKLIADSATVITDGAGEFNAARQPLRGRQRAINFHLRIARRRGATAVPTLCNVNGMPAVLVRFPERDRRGAPAGLLRCELDEHGRIREIHWVLATRKLAFLNP